jgi:hypothetical protein
MSVVKGKSVLSFPTGSSTDPTHYEALAIFALALATGSPALGGPNTDDCSQSRGHELPGVESENVCSLILQLVVYIYPFRGMARILHLALSMNLHVTCHLILCLSVEHHTDINTSHRQPKLLTSGRGGAKNMRSLSRDTVSKPHNAFREEANLVREHTTAHANAVANGEVPVSHGCRGAVNISNSRSRPRSRDPASNHGVTALHSSGRGGYGNFKVDEPSTTLGSLAEEEDRKIAEERQERKRKDGQSVSLTSSRSS